MTAFQCILKLATELQSIKNKYPMIVSYLKHLQKCSGNPLLEEKEINAFKEWLKENPQLPTLSSQFYKSSKPTICFKNVYDLGSDVVVEQFKTNLREIESLIFPEGRPLPIEKSVSPTDPEMTPGVASAMAAIEGNPIFSSLLDNIKDVVSDSDVANDPSSIMENKNFKVLLKNIQRGIDSGKYNLSDISSTINAVIGSVQNELDDSMSSVMSEAVGMLSAVERGHQPDIGRIMELLKTINFK